MAKTIIHVNQHKIKSNAKHGRNEPALTVKSRRENRPAHEAIIKDATGQEVARVVYRPHKPLSCGARCWIESEHTVETTVERGATKRATKAKPRPRAKAKPKPKPKPKPRPTNTKAPPQPKPKKRAKPKPRPRARKVKPRHRAPARGTPRRWWWP